MAMKKSFPDNISRNTTVSLETSQGEALMSTNERFLFIDDVIQNFALDLTLPNPVRSFSLLLDSK
jgi:hypothetical protein